MTFAKNVFIDRRRTWQFSLAGVQGWKTDYFQKHVKRKVPFGRWHMGICCNKWLLDHRVGQVFPAKLSHHTNLLMEVDSIMGQSLWDTKSFITQFCHWEPSWYIYTYLDGTNSWTRNKFVPTFTLLQKGNFIINHYPTTKSFSSTINLVPSWF